MNERDSDMLAALLRQRGHEPTKREADADIVIVNTCSVRAKSESKALGKLGLLIASKRDRPERIVGAVGCMVQRIGVDILRMLPGLDFAVGARRLRVVPDVLESVLKGGSPIMDADLDENFSPAILKSRETAGVSAFINILLGCDRRCSYCIVPDVRGPEWSRPASDVIEEAREVVGTGAREIILLGQSVLSYGRRNPVWRDECESGMGFNEPFPRLLEALSGIACLDRIRFTSAHPSGCTVELARAFAELSPVCEHIHLPLQSGSDRILRLMRRGYSTSDFRAAAALLRAAVPGLAMTTDVIVGFPSESDDDFEATRAFMDEMMFDNAFIFKYSARQGTHAYRMKDDVSDEEKLRRNHVLLEDQDRRGMRLNGALVGRDVEVLVEGTSKRNKSRWAGRTRTNKIVVFDADPHPVPGELVMVSIERAGAQTIYGKMRNR